MISLTEIFRENLNKKIQSSPHSLSELARKSGYSVSYISRVLTGERGNPSLFFVDCMAAVLQVTPQYLLEER